MKLSSIIDRELLVTDLKLRDTNGVLTELTNLLKQKNKISDTEPILEKLLEREKLASTSIGKNTAIPHARIKEIKTPILVMALCREGFLYNTNDSEPVHLVILVLSPSGSPALHLQILAAAASLIKRPGNLIGELLKVKSCDEFAVIIKKIEEIND